MGPNLCPTGLDKVYFIQVFRGVCSSAAISRKNVESEKLDFFRENAKSTIEKSNCSEIEYYISLVMSVFPGRRPGTMLLVVNMV